MRLALCFLFLSQYFWLCLASDFSLLPPFGVASWSVGGDAKFTSGYIRLAEDRQSKTGWLWNDLPNVYSAWEVVFEFRIHGVSRVGADGLAFWYTSQSKISGSVLGNQENFKGLGILIDTYDNDNSGMHPFLAVLVNDGTKPFIHDHEKGEGHNDSGAELGGCSVAVRNLQHTSRVKVVYNHNVLTISTALDGSSDFKTCVETADIELSPGWFFGFTAATGHLADNHDLYSVVIRNLGAPIVTPQGGGPSNRAEGASDVIKILSNIQHQVHGIQTQDREHTVSSQKQLQSRIDKLSSDVVSLRNYLADMDVYLRDFLEKPKPNVAAATADPAGNRLFNDLANNVARQFEKFEKDQARKIQDLRSILSSSNDQGKTTERGYAEWLLWLIFGSVLLFGGLMTIAQIRRSQRRQKKYF